MCKMELEIYENVKRHEHRLYNLVNSQNSNKRSMVETVIRKTTSQIYKVHGSFQIRVKSIIS
jgi:hypothetical protein